MPRAYVRKTHDGYRLTDADFAWRDRLTLLIRHYESVRNSRGSEHDMAERALGEALIRNGGPFRLDDWIWWWSRAERSVMRCRAGGMHMLTDRAPCPAPDPSPAAKEK
jgi:hypothetical protein